MRRGLTALCLVALAAPAAGAPEAEPRVELTCRREPAPGRVVCDLDVETERTRLAWGDALVVKAPEFARPVRSRVGVGEARTRNQRRLQLPLAFVATTTGKGEVVVLVRAVICSTQPGSSEELCVPETRRARGSIEVGLEESKSPR
jgi:hypothetical protein